MCVCVAWLIASIMKKLVFLWSWGDPFGFDMFCLDSHLNILFNLCFGLLNCCRKLPHSHLLIPAIWMEDYITWRIFFRQLKEIDIFRPLLTIWFDLQIFSPLSQPHWLLIVGYTFNMLCIPVVCYCYQKVTVENLIESNAEEQKLHRDARTIA